MYQWVERFQSGRTRVTDGDLSGHLTTSQMADTAEQVSALVQEERWITVTDGADKLDMSCGSAYSINFCSNIMKEERLSCNGLSQAMKHGCTTVNLEANVKAWGSNT